MKIAAIAALCKKGAYLYIAPESEGEGVIQYVGNGAAAYAIDGMPRLTKDSASTLFDIAEDKKDKFALPEFDIHKGILIGAEELPLVEKRVRIVFRGAEYAVFRIEGHYDLGVLCVDTKYLKPLAAEFFNDFYARDDGCGHWQIVVKRGVEIRAIICITKKPLEEECLDAIDSISLGLQRALELGDEEEQPEDDQVAGQQSLFGELDETDEEENTEEETDA